VELFRGCHARAPPWRVTSRGSGPVSSHGFFPKPGDSYTSPLSLLLGLALASCEGRKKRRACPVFPGRPFGVY